MIELNYLAIAAAVVGAFVVSAVYYGVLSSPMARLSDAYRPESQQARPAVWTVLVELVRNLALAGVLAVIGHRLGIVEPAGAILLAISLWLALPAVLLSGSIFHERYSWKLAAIHAGDWLLKLLVVTLITTLWR